MRISALVLAVPLMVYGADALYPPVALRVAATGLARGGCGPTDYPAVEFVFKVENRLPTVTVKDPNVINPTTIFVAPLVGNQELHVRVNGRLATVKRLQSWKNPEAWVCPVDGYPCDFATAGIVTLARADSDAIDGQLDLTFQSGNQARSTFSTKVIPRVPGAPRSFCGE